MTTLTIAFPAKSQINAQFAMNLLEALDGLKAKTGFTIRIKYLLGKSNLSHARSILVTEWYDQASAQDLFMFIDTDQTFLDDTIIRVLRLQGDLRAGLYANRLSSPTSIPESNTFTTAENIPLSFAATGFLCFTYNAITKIHTYMKNTEGIDRVIISDNIANEENCIPLFQPVFATLNNKPKKYWLGEDFSFSYRAKKAGLTISGAIIHTLGHEIPSVFHLAKPLRPSKTWPQNSLVYYCGNSRIRFSPNDQKLGGSEQAVVNLSKELVKLGLRVTVYGNVDPITQDGVTYLRHEEFVVKDKFNLIVLWRRYGLEALGPLEFANGVYVDLHDATPLPKELIENKVKKVFVKSKYHRSIYPALEDSKFVIVANGLLPTKIATNTTRLKNRFCYTSCYERGLIPIITHMWPHIKKHVPNAEFHIYYGSELISDKTKQNLETLLNMNKGSVFEHGRGTHDEIMTERRRCIAQLYVTDSPLEIDCLSIREAASVGCIPIISTKGVFPERVGLHITGDPTQAQTLEMAATQVVKICSMPDHDLDRYRKALEANALTQTWETTAKLWVTNVGTPTLHRDAE